VNKNGQPDRRFSNNYQIPIYALKCVQVRADNSFAEDFYFAQDGGELMKWRPVSQWHAASQRASSQDEPDVLLGNWYFYHRDGSPGVLRAVSLIEVHNNQLNRPGLNFLFRDGAILVSINRALCPGINVRAPFTFDLYLDEALLLPENLDENGYETESNSFTFFLANVGNKMTLDRMLDGAKEFTFRVYQNGRQMNSGRRELPAELYSALQGQLPQERLQHSQDGFLPL